MAGPTHLLDTSVLARASKPQVAARIAAMMDAGELATCAVTDLEVLFSARSGAEHRERRADLQLRFFSVALDAGVFARALEVQGLLADRGQHRAASIPDLVVAAAGELAGLAVLHYDGDFELIASVTGQRAEWVVPRGSVD